MNNRELVAVLEALLFVSGEPIEIDMLSEVLKLNEKNAVNVIDDTINLYNETSIGLEMTRLGNSVQLLTKADKVDFITELASLHAKKPKPMSKASLEILAIIAYNQPVTRGFIDQVRGVDSSYTVSQLSDNGFIEECGRLDAPGRPLLFATTVKFLRYFGIRDIEELPDVSIFGVQGNKEDFGQQTLL